jgi:hypothetical protein
MNEVKLVRTLVDDNKMEAMVQKLDRLTQDEGLLTGAQILKVVHVVLGLVENMKVVMDGDNLKEALAEREPFF